MSAQKFIDTAGIIKSRNPALYRLLPGCVLRGIKRILHEDELNEFLLAHAHDEPADFVDASLERLGVKSRIISPECPLPRLCIYVANHPLGGPDGLMLMQHLNRMGIGFRSLSNDLLNHLNPIRQWMIRVNSFGRQSRQLTSEVEESVGVGNSLLIFPSGYVSRPFKDGIRDLPWKKTFIQMAVSLRIDVVPVSISGTTSNRFLRLARWRKRLGIRANLEMFLLADEMFRLSGKEFTLYFHPPIPWQTFTDGQHPKEWARQIERSLYERHPQLIRGTHES
ncbi:MAG: glycerol acyltransferase [Sphingomonadales bacterium]|nr:glycerol acyltransferase [Sphingomonadales bacterium]